MPRRIIQNLLFNSRKLIGDRLSIRAKAWYGLRRIYADYLGFAIRVRKTVLGVDIFADIGFDSNGNLDIGALLAFAIDATGGNVFIQTHYDLTGNGFHQIQNTKANQAQIVSSGVFIQPTYLNSSYTGSLVLGHPFTVNTVARNTSTSTTTVRAITGRGTGRASLGVLNASPANSALALWSPTINRGIYANNTVSTNPIILTGVAPSLDESTWVLYLNGTPPSAAIETTGVTTDSGTIIIGSSGNVGENWIGSISEVSYFTNILSAGDLDILHRDQGVYYGL